MGGRQKVKRKTLISGSDEKKGGKGKADRKTRTDKGKERKIETDRDNGREIETPTVETQLSF